MYNFLIAALISLVFLGCDSSHTKELTVEIESKLVDKYTKMKVIVEHNKDTLNIVMLDTFQKFSKPFADLRATYVVSLIHEYIGSYQFVEINQLIGKDTMYLRNNPYGSYKKLYSKKDLNDIKELYGEIFEFHFCVNYIMNSVPPEEYDIVCESHTFNQHFLEGYFGKESFTSLIVDFTMSCGNPTFSESLTYNKMCMLAMVSAKNYARTRGNMFDVFFNICNLPKVDVNDVPPFQPTPEYQKYILEKMELDK